MITPHTIINYTISRPADILLFINLYHKPYAINLKVNYNMFTVHKPIYKTTHNIVVNRSKVIQQLLNYPVSLDDKEKKFYEKFRYSLMLPYIPFNDFVSMFRFICEDIWDCQHYCLNIENKTNLPEDLLSGKYIYSTDRFIFNFIMNELFQKRKANIVFETGHTGCLATYNTYPDNSQVTYIPVYNYEDFKFLLFYNIGKQVNVNKIHTYPNKHIKLKNYINIHLHMRLTSEMLKDITLWLYKYYKTPQDMKRNLIITCEHGLFEDKPNPMTVNLYSRYLYLTGYRTIPCMLEPQVVLMDNKSIKYYNHYNGLVYKNEMEVFRK